MKVKGGGVKDFVPLQREVRQVLDAWLKERDDKIMPLFPRCTGRRMPGYLKRKK